MGVRCAQCGAEAGDGARFCSACGAELEGSGRRERKLATIAFADIVGSTELVGGRDPEDVRRLLDPFLDLARRTFEKHGGRVEKFVGDAAVAVFGVPEAHGDDPDRAVAAALALVEQLPKLSEGLRLRVGIETGQVLVEPGSADLAVTGDATYAAARLQQAAEPGEVLVGERAAAGARRASLEAPREVGGKGFPRPLVARAATGIEASGDLDRTPFLGRGAELEQLRLAYLRTERERSPTLALIVGEAGVGKTRLARELLAAVRALAPTPDVLIGRNPPYGDGIAFWALGEILRAAARVSSDASPADIHDGLEARLSAVAPDRRGEVAATLVATATGEGEHASTSAGALRLAWRRLLASIAAERPLVIAVDDAHWADGEFLDLLEDTAANLSGFPIMVLCTARPLLAQSRPGFAAQGVRLDLGPLREDAAIELAAALLADADPALARQIASTSGGNPFFAEEIARALPGRQGAVDQLPDTVQTAIASRLDALPPGEKAVLQHAAVLGDRFGAEHVAALTGGDASGELAGLVAKSLVRERTADGPDAFSFHHQLIRDVAYESLPRSDRTRLHEAAAAEISTIAVDRHPELAEVIAFHRMQAAELEPTDERRHQAFAAARAASERALRRGAAPRAQELLERGGSIAPTTPEHVEALTDAADIAMTRVRGDEAYRLLRAAGEVAESAGEPRLAAVKYARAAEVPARSGGISGFTAEAEVRALLARCRELVPDPDPGLEAQIQVNEAFMAWRFGPIDEMGPAAREALELARASGDVRLLSSALDAVGATSQHEGRYHDAVASIRERVALLSGAEQGAYGYERSDVVWMLSEGLTRIGDLKGAVEAELEAVPDFLLTAPHRAYANALFPLLHLGEWDRAIEYATTVRSNWLEQGEPPFAALAGDIAVIGLIFGLRDDEVTSQRWFTFAEDLARDNPQLDGVRLFQADLTLYRGDPEQALAILDSQEPDFWWSDQMRAKRVEILATLGSSEAEPALTAAEAHNSDDPLDTAVLLRARSILSGDPAAARASCELLDRHDYLFEGVRTRWFLGGSARESAVHVLERLGALPPG